MILAGIFILSTLVVIDLIAISNALTFPRLKPGRLPGDHPFVSLLVPARDEAAKIRTTVAALLAQDYPRFEVIVLDDDSSDGTALLALEAAAGDQRLRVVSSEPLPAGWAGKNWACYQLAWLAQGEVLVFTDADVRWERQALSALVACMKKHRGDMFTVWPTQLAVTWSERLVVPMMLYAVLCYLSEVCVRWIPWESLSAANGQCLAFTRSAYEQVGGHAAVRGTVLEDVTLARLVKRKGLRLVQALGEGLVWARMYRNWDEVRRGFAKNILAGHGGSPFFLVLSAVYHWSLFLLPLAWLLAGALTDLPLWPAFPLGMLALGFGARLLSAATSRHRLLDVLWMPVSVLLMTAIAAQALWWHFTQGGPQWKGRVIAPVQGTPNPGITNAEAQKGREA